MYKVSVVPAVSSQSMKIRTFNPAVEADSNHYWDRLVRGASAVLPPAADAPSAAAAASICLKKRTSWACASPKPVAVCNDCLIHPGRPAAGPLPGDVYLCVRRVRVSVCVRALVCTGYMLISPRL
jgi:hypothetical protein